jgi:tetratricopeptide (TPR) repeat protein
MTCSAALAKNDPVPGNTLLCELPASARVVVKKKIVLTRATHVYKAALTGPRSSAQDFFVSHKDGVSALEPGAEMPVKGCEKVSADYQPLFLNLKQTNLFASAWFYFYAPIPKTVNDFNNTVGDDFQIVYNDPGPYPGLEPAAIVDIEMSIITAALKEKDYAKALPHFAYLEKMGIGLPESFHYYYIETLEQTGTNEKARERATAYLTKYGRQGKYYSNVVAIVGRVTIAAEKDAKEKAIEAARKSKEYAEIKKRYDERVAEYERNVANCPDNYESALESAGRSVRTATADCERGNGQASCEYIQSLIDRHGSQYHDKRIDRLKSAKRHLRDLEMSSEDQYCHNRYRKPEKPVMPS